MRVYLPSHGIFGQRIVDLKVPTFGVLHELQSYNNEEILKKFRLLELVSNADFNKITYMDFEYLYNIVAFALMFNVATYKLECPSCKEKLTKRLQVTELDINELKLKAKDLPYVKHIKGERYSFSILKASQVREAYDWAIYEEDTEFAFKQAKVAFIMGKKVDQIDYVKSLPISVYLSASLFQRMFYHGFSDEVKMVCHKCGKEFRFRYNIPISSIEFDIDKMMNRFVSVTEYVTFTDFLKMSIIDFNAFVSEINSRIK